jgi:D-tyrosyl-tRNA(Tyr) deacylase
MRAVVQRVSSARVRTGGLVTGEIGPGLLVLLGVTHDDTTRQADWLAGKMAVLRVFEDEGGRMNRSLAEVGGSVLAVSQFTLYGACRKGRRPSFDAAAGPERARELYERFVAELRRLGVAVATGVFQAHMQVELINDGPVTLVIDTADRS